ALYRKVGDGPQMLMVGDNLAQVYLKEGKPEQAIALSRDSLADERAEGRESDALTSQYNIARALQAMGQHRQAMDLISTTVEQARKAHFGAGLPDLLQEQSRMAERDGDFELALASEREAFVAARDQWSKNLASQEASLAARYAARETEIRIQELERNSQIRKLKLQTAEAEATRNALRVRRQRATLVASVLAAIGLLVGVISLLVLLRSQRRYTRELRRQALEDPLTGVANRRGFFQQAEAMLGKRDAGQSLLHALLLFDFDNFKGINDRCGHPFGDIVLNVSLQCLRPVVGTRGRLARLGGEEFVVLCPRMGGAAALQLAEEMRAAMGALELPNAPDDLAVTISIGVALFDGVRCHDLGSWMGTADRAMYAAKSRGRDQVVVAHAVNELLNRAVAEPQPAR
ncbi:MAG: diguanylate cyclase, partial [Rhodanobacteraceae bacterium]